MHILLARLPTFLSLKFAEAALLLMETTIDFLSAIETKMKAEKLPDLAVKSFSYYYKQLIEGETGLIAEKQIQPVDSLPDLEQLSDEYLAVGETVLKSAVMLKLNGGLGTSMGLKRAKSLLIVKNGQSFLDIIAQQAIRLGIPLVLMNSFSTAQDSLQHLSKHPELKQDIPLHFLQHKVPKIVQKDYSLAEWPKDPQLEWCPPGHGDIYTALLTTNMLDNLLENGVKYMFVSNSDNLGAQLDLKLLGYFADQRLPFMMEVADRTLADRKGGHLALDHSGQFLLRESAQCPQDDLDAFQDTQKHRYFNTNNLWIQLETLKDVLNEKNGIMGLPMIRNSKTVDPRDSSSTAVYQLETAMGAAIEIFKDAGAVRVPRSRFAPVKSTNQLLAIQSDAYLLQDDYSVVMDQRRNNTPCIINLDGEFYKKIDQLDEHFPFGAPSLINAESLTIKGDVFFGRNVTCNGVVEVVNTSGQARYIADDQTLSGVVDISS